MKEKRLLVALAALSAALAACGSSTSGTPDSNGNNAATGGSSSTPGGGTAGGTTTPGGGTGGGIDNPVGACMMGVPTTSQIPRMLNRQYENAVRDLLGVTSLDGAPVSAALVGDFQGAMTAPAWKVYQEVGAKIAAQVMAGANKSMFIACDPAAAGCLETTIKTFGRKAFRRPLTDDEVTSFKKLSAATPAGTPAQVAEATLNAFLISPSFLLIPELNTEAEGSAIKLSSYEVAARLSFMLWGSVPDDALNQAADTNALDSKDKILAQAQRMVMDRSKTGPLVSAFHDDWAQMNNGAGHWWKLDHDVSKYPLYAPAAKVSYGAELDKFFEEVAYSNGSFKDLLLSNVAFVNKDNAAIYGLDPAQYTADLQKVTLSDPANPRPGFLTRAGFLSSYSNYDSTSPILRGAFIAVNLVSVNPGAPIPGAKDATVTGTFATQHDYVQALTQVNQPCKGCHDVVNPYGYTLENYDAIGKWQTTDPRGGAIDAKITTQTVDFGDNVTKQIASPQQLMEEIAKMPKAQALYAKAWVTYAFGRSINAYDQCVVDQLQTKLAGDGYTILNVLSDLTQADSFRLRVRQTP